MELKTMAVVPIILALLALSEAVDFSKLASSTLEGNPNHGPLMQLRTEDRNPRLLESFQNIFGFGTGQYRHENENVRRSGAFLKPPNRMPQPVRSEPAHPGSHLPPPNAFETQVGKEAFSAAAPQAETIPQEGHDGVDRSQDVGDRRFLGNMLSIFSRRRVPNALDATVGQRGNFQANNLNNNNAYRNNMQLLTNQQLLQQQSLINSPHTSMQQVEIMQQNMQMQQQLQRLQLMQQQQMLAQQQIQRTGSLGMCEDKYQQLVSDIFMANEIVPELFDSPPAHLLELSYRTVRTYPGMKLTADVTRGTPMLRWPAKPDTYYTVILSNLDINSRQNRTLAEFWHWFVGNVPGTNIDDGDEIFALLHPLVLQDGHGDHRYAFYVLEQPNGDMDFSEEGGPTDNCSPKMSEGRGPFRSTSEFMRRYDMKFHAATFLIVDYNEVSNEIACEWQNCMGGQVFLQQLNCDQRVSSRLRSATKLRNRQFKKSKSRSASDSQSTAGFW